MSFQFSLLFPPFSAIRFLYTKKAVSSPQCVALVTDSGLFALLTFALGLGLDLAVGLVRLAFTFHRPLSLSATHASSIDTLAFVERSFRPKQVHHFGSHLRKRTQSCRVLHHEFLHPQP